MNSKLTVNKDVYYVLGYVTLLLSFSIPLVLLVSIKILNLVLDSLT